MKPWPMVAVKMAYAAGLALDFSSQHARWKLVNPRS
jgi:hypothetical protein